MCQSPFAKSCYESYEDSDEVNSGISGDFVSPSFVAYLAFIGNSPSTQTNMKSNTGSKTK